MHKHPKAEKWAGPIWRFQHTGMLFSPSGVPPATSHQPGAARCSGCCSPCSPRFITQAYPSTPFQVASAPWPPFLGSPEVPRYTAHLPDTPYLSQGSDYRTFHYASKEDQVQFCGPGGIGQGSQVVQDLLHSWGRGGEMLNTSRARKTKTQHRPCYSYPHGSYPAASSTLPS